MKHFSATDKLWKVIHSNYQLLPIFNRFGISLGFKEKTVADICEEKNIDENFFLTIINTYSNKGYFPEEQLLSFSPTLLVDYLRKTHNYYREYLFPEVERLLQKLIASCTNSCDNILAVNTFYQKYKQELEKHISEEDIKVFPYIKAVTEAIESKTAIDEKWKGYSMQNFEQEHVNVDQKIYDLKNIIIKFLEPNYNDNDCNNFLTAIFEFENDLKDHARIEDKVLFNKVIELEKQLING